MSGDMIQPDEHIRWFWVYLDCQLLFKQHMSIWCAKTLKLALA